MLFEGLPSYNLVRLLRLEVPISHFLKGGGISPIFFTETVVHIPSHAIHLTLYISESDTS